MRAVRNRRAGFGWNGSGVLKSSVAADARRLLIVCVAVTTDRRPWPTPSRACWSWGESWAPKRAVRHPLSSPPLKTCTASLRTASG